MCLFDERKRAVIQLQQGYSRQDVATNLGRSVSWVGKWQRRYEQESWAGLQSRSRAPRQVKGKTTPTVKAAIWRVRQELACAATLGQGLKYIGSRAIRTRLKQENVNPLPSLTTIERVLRESGLTRQGNIKPPEIVYPRLQASQPHELLQIDIVPHHLTGGQRIFCFNSLDVVSRYPTGRAYERKRSQEAVAFMVHCWQEQGIPRYTQLDNEGCFSGGSTHPYVLGKVVRLGLKVGTELVFTPIRHPKSNGHIERFHQEYSRHVWEDTYLTDVAAVNRQGEQFFTAYRHRVDHRQLQGESPEHWHQAQTWQALPADFTVPADMPLYEGRLHFMRRLEVDGTVRVLNADWAAPGADPLRGIWVTLMLNCAGATLQLFTDAPDVGTRQLLAQYPFPLNEPILPHPVTSEPEEAIPEAATMLSQELMWLTSSVAQKGEQLILSTLDHTATLTKRFFATMF